ncbi:hypothetical protein N7447_004655, partial [Penicillium robsamsonii]|uniref:uncharacterized protein n=1 Tax=Penicillium robsamsonii TaxID=1792511 RepID=UPI002546994E
YKMFLFLLLAILYIRTSYGGSVKVIDHDGECLMWSDDNHGCTGYSEPFALLDGDDCSRLSKVIKDKREYFNKIRVNICGTENGLPVAWIELDQSGLVVFMNQNGDHSVCILEDGFNVRSSCPAAS